MLGVGNLTLNELWEHQRQYFRYKYQALLSKRLIEYIRVITTGSGTISSFIISSKLCFILWALFAAAFFTAPRIASAPYSELEPNNINSNLVTDQRQNFRFGQRKACNRFIYQRGDFSLVLWSVSTLKGGTYFEFGKLRGSVRECFGYYFWTPLWIIVIRCNACGHLLCDNFFKICSSLVRLCAETFLLSFKLWVSVHQCTGCFEHSLKQWACHQPEATTCFWASDHAWVSSEPKPLVFLEGQAGRTPFRSCED